MSKKRGIVKRISQGLFDDIELERRRMQKELGRDIFFSDASDSLSQQLKKKRREF